MLPPQSRLKRYHVRLFQHTVRRARHEKMTETVERHAGLHDASHASRLLIVRAGHAHRTWKVRRARVQLAAMTQAHLFSNLAEPVATRLPHRTSVPACHVEHRTEITMDGRDFDLPIRHQFMVAQSDPCLTPSAAVDD